MKVARGFILHIPLVWLRTAVSTLSYKSPDGRGTTRGSFLLVDTEAPQSYNLLALRPNSQTQDREGLIL
jgi:hypothetical protein